ncbi:MAG TPA: hypothetical protein VNQ79_15030 [Blastocatellia bacterium]|nr:hypothetical protein [Blastocatellia bacterium]
MLVYRSAQRTVCTASLLAELNRGLKLLAQRGCADHELATELLIEFGELEAGVADALCPELDSDDQRLRVLRQTSLLLGHVLNLSWEHRTDEIRPWQRSLESALDELPRLALPDSVRLSMPEGYAYYGLYPETYLAAAERFLHSVHPQRAVVIGIRSIGTSLSAVVAAALAAGGVEMESFTVRPRGHPFDRRLLTDAALAARWQRRREAHFLIVDEGPGLSGSSFACVAQKLSEPGVRDEQIALFPGWEPDGRQFVSTAARARWPRPVSRRV